MRTVVVASIVVSVGGFALIASARDGSSTAIAQNTAPGAVNTQPAGKPTTTAAAAPADSLPADPAAEGEAVPDLAVAPTELTDDCAIPPESITTDSESLDVQWFRWDDVPNSPDGELAGMVAAGRRRLDQS